MNSSGDIPFGLNDPNLPPARLRKTPVPTLASPESVILKGIVAAANLGGYSLSYYSPSQQLGVSVPGANPRIGGWYRVGGLPVGEWFVLADRQGFLLPVAVQKIREDAYYVRVDPAPLQGLRAVASLPGSGSPGTGGNYVDWIGNELQKGEQGFYGSGARHTAMPGYVQEIGTEFPAQDRVVYVHPRDPVAFYMALPQLRVHTGVSARPGAWPLTNAPLSAQKFEMLEGSELLSIWHVPGFSPGSWIRLATNTIWVPLMVKVEGAILYARWGTSVLSAPPNLADFPRQASTEDAYNLGWSCEQKADYAAAEGGNGKRPEQGHTLSAILLGRLVLYNRAAEGMRWLLWRIPRRPESGDPDRHLAHERAEPRA